jgi:hypothetical protein
MLELERSYHVPKVNRSKILSLEHVLLIFSISIKTGYFRKRR